MLWLVTRYEGLSLLRSKRAWFLLATHACAAALGGLLYGLALRKVLDELANPTDPAVGALGKMLAGSVTGSAIYDQMVAFFAGSDASAINPSLLASYTAPPFLWAALALLPYTIVATAYDSIAADTAKRSHHFALLRVSRRTLLLGKALAQWLAAVILVAASAIVFALVANRFASQDVLGDWLGMVWAWIVLIPYAAVYVALTILISTAVRRPALALWIGTGVVMLWRSLGITQHIPESSTYAPLAYLQHLSPALYFRGLWRWDTDLPISLTVYTAAAAALLWVAAENFRRRDL